MTLNYHHCKNNRCESTLKYKVGYPKWMKHPAVLLNEVIGIPLDRMKLTGSFVIVNWDVDVTECERKGFTVEEFDETEIVIDIMGTRCKVVTPIDDFLNQELNNLCSYEVPGARFFKKTDWNGIVHLYNHKAKRFSVGLTYMVKDAIKRYLKDEGSVVITDQRPEPKKIEMPDELSGITLRPYQVQAVERGMEMGSGLLNLCVGAGKTEIAIEIMRRHATYSAVLVHTKELLYQARDRIEERLGIDVGQIGDGVCDPKPMCVMMFQSLARYIEDEKGIMIKDKIDIEKYDKDDTDIKIPIKELLAAYSSVTVDQCETIPARTFYKSLNCFDNARYRYGLSARYDRDDGQEMAIYSQIGTVIHKVSASELIRLGYLIRPTVKFMKMPILPRGLYTGKAYQAVYRDYIVDNDSRNGIIIEQLFRMVRDQRKVLVLVDQIRHGDELVKQIDRYNANLNNPINVKLRRVKGEVSTKIRKEVMTQFKAGELDCIVATTSLYQKGVDIPVASGLINAGAGQSRGKMTEMIGRIVRTHPESGKTDALFIDFNDRPYYLAKHFKERLACAREEEEYEVIVE